MYSQPRDGLRHKGIRTRTQCRRAIHARHIGMLFFTTIIVGKGVVCKRAVSGLGRCVGGWEWEREVTQGLPTITFKTTHNHTQPPFVLRLTQPRWAIFTLRDTLKQSLLDMPGRQRQNTQYVGCKPIRSCLSTISCKTSKDIHVFQIHSKNASPWLSSMAVPDKTHLWHRNSKITKCDIPHIWFVGRVGNF